MNFSEVEFRRKAEAVLIQEGFRPRFTPEALSEAASIQDCSTLDSSVADLRQLLWSSIDNPESRDLDQVEWAEKLSNGDIRVLVGIADVISRVKQHSAIDEHAGFNATSVYTGGPVFPMLPDQLSTGATSLHEGADRRALVVEFVVGQNGDVNSGKLYPAIVRNQARLTYDRVGPWLHDQAATFAEPGYPADLPSQLQLQHEASHRLMRFREEHGALAFGGAERMPVFVNNEVRFATTERNAARDVIESFMIAANVTIASYLRRQGLFSIRRVVRKPKRWDRIQAIASARGTQLPNEPDSRALSRFMAAQKKADPASFAELSLAILKSLGRGEYVVQTPGQNMDGHFGLAVQDYSHSTAPNRRYADLLIQRQIAAHLGGAQPPYAEIELANLAQHCTDREAKARDVERFMKKVAAAMTLRPHIGERFHGIVTGVTHKGTFVRLFQMPVEGRVMRGEQGLDIGERVCVRLVGVDVDKGFIDFEAVG